ncbi:MAG: hypothetical protein EOP04_27950 [Proteobacteria bacterium]|nr:MAG: hypothetical protein EOP04_27950 [Pseudomonadota bacterium]
MGSWKSRNISIFIEGAATRPIQGDRFLLFQSFRNILQNAIEFSRDGSSVKVKVREIDSDVMIEFIDEGSGIPEYALDRVFDKFFSLERPHSEQRSSGLGLSFVKEAMELHGARITYESPVKNGHGTWVTLQFHAERGVSG